MMRDSVKSNYHTISSVQQGNRPAVIFSSDFGNRTNSTVIVLKITSCSEKGSKSVNVHYLDESGKSNVVLCNQITTVDKSDLLEYMYTLSDETMRKVETAHQLATDTVPVKVDDKIDKIYKILEDLAVIKSNCLHDTSRDEKFIAEIANELQKLYANMSKYHDSTVEELRNSIPAINDSNAKIRMGLHNVGKSTESKSSSENNVNDLSKGNRNSGKQSRVRKPSGYWTDERIKEFVSDKDKLPLNDWMEKYKYTDRQTIMKAYYTYSSKLNKVK